jgi:RND family efflux transporter MFP subunit
MKIFPQNQRLRWASALTVLTLVACGEPPAVQLAEVARPVKSIIVAGPDGGNLRNFTGRVDSANKAEMAFRVAGKIEKLAVNEGEVVKKGQLLAQLDQTEFRLTLQDRQATYDRTEKNFDRAEELITSGNISQRDYDTINADLKSADAALEQARQNLSYTSLVADFAGSVAKRHVEAFEEVLAKQTVFSMIDESSLLVRIDLPESLILHLPQGGNDADRRKKTNVTASFGPAPDKHFPLSFREVSKRADAKTQTFEATFNLAKQNELTILPGMTADVTVDLSQILSEAIHYIPITAVSANSGLEARVWTVDEETMTVHEQNISVGRMLGSSIAVTDGLEIGSRIVTAGAAFLAEGMKVTLMKEVEQAESRPDDRPSTDQQ